VLDPTSYAHGCPTLDIESGKVAHILIGVSNDGDTEYTVQNLEASFRFHMDFNQVLQNVRFLFPSLQILGNSTQQKKKKKKFTTYRYGVPLKPGEQATLSYRWPIQALFEPAEFGFTLLVTYEDAVKQIPFRSGAFILFSHPFFLSFSRSRRMVSCTRAPALTEPLLLLIPSGLSTFRCRPSFSFLCNIFGLHISPPTRLFILIFLAVAFGGAGYYAYMNVTGGVRGFSALLAQACISYYYFFFPVFKKPTAKFSSQLSKPAAPETKEEKKERKKDVDMSWIPDHNIKKSPKLGTK